MSLEEWIIAIVRVAGSLLVLRWAFAGGIIAVLIDLSDLFLKNVLDLGGVNDYQTFDKWLDQVYLAAFLVVAVRDWRGPAREIAVALYAFRIAGFVTYTVVDERWVMLLFPNVFEFWFIFVASLPHWRPGFRYTPRNVALVLATLLALKLGQEYMLHVGQWLDDFTTLDVLEALWDALSWPWRALT